MFITAVAEDVEQDRLDPLRLDAAGSVALAKAARPAMM